MSNITKQTRRESYDEVLKDLNKRQALVYAYLRSFPEGTTAKNLAVHMHSNGDASSPERNSTHPRLNELVKKGYVEIIGKRQCEYTGRKVAVYKVKEV